MTAKDKAIELVNKFRPYADKRARPTSLNLSGSSGGITFNTQDLMKSAKQCALIAAEELIVSFSDYKGMYDQDFFESEATYWNDVKNNIEKL